MSDLFTSRDVDYMETAVDRLTIAIRGAKLSSMQHTAHCDLNAVVSMLSYVKELVDAKDAENFKAMIDENKKYD